MSVRHKVYSIGYTGFPVDQFLAFVRERKLLLVDVRLKPFSRFHPHWNRNALAAALPGQYAWLEALGNLNYKGGPIALKSPDAGIQQVRDWLEDQDVALLCACGDHRVCHRTTVAQVLSADGYEVEVVVRPGGVPQPRKPPPPKPPKSLLPF